MFMYNHPVHMMLIKDLYQYGMEFLTSNSVPTPGTDAAILLNKVTGLGLIDVYRDPETDIPQQMVEQYNELLERRVHHEPVAYILGHKEFYSRTFCVNSSVLIPRPETEMLVDEVKEIARNINSPVILDLGTGSGCIAITLKGELGDSSCFASDNSVAALGVAAHNAEAIGLEVCFICGDLLQGFKSSVFDIIVSNPPYISDEDYTKLEKNVKNFEPREALVSKDDGLYVIRNIVFHSRYVIKHGGWLVIEVGYNQSEAVRQLFESSGYKNIDIIKDLAGIERVIKAQWIN